MRTLMFAGVGSLAAGILVPVFGVGNAGASSATNTVTATNYRFNAVGSDTIYCEDNAVANSYNRSQSKTGKSGNQIDNTPPVLKFNFGCKTSASTFSVPADSVHGAITYNCVLKNTTLSAAITTSGPITALRVNPAGAALQSGKNVTVGGGSGIDTFVTSAAVAQGATSIPVQPETPAHNEASGAPVSAPDCIPGDGALGNLPPDGSGAGISALVADNGAGNIAYARSSRGRAGSDPSTIHFWAFALDAVSWSTFAGTNAPTNLTTSDLTGIFECNITNWDQISDIPGYTGPNAIIQVWYPQPGSGTGAFFAKLFTGNVFPSGPCINYGEENNGLSISQQGSFDSANAIYPYSVAVHTALPGNTGGATLGSVNGVAPTSANISEQNANENLTGNACTDPTATGFCATRFVYHVTSDALLTNHAAYAKAVLGLVGVKPGATATPTSGYCGNKENSKIAASGFIPLALANTGGQFPTVKSYCREQ